ncbi:M20/M25/M40 family metallo-hydrolase, partial [bacterium]|nr:M20/M25/M40 family metallo-hydrolase [bacterium]
MMMWNMLRQDVGDALFIKGVRAFYSGNRFTRASYDDIREAFESVTDTDFGPFFKQWVERTGAPQLSLSGVKTERDESGYSLKVALKQIQRKKPYSLNIPIAISFKEKLEMRKVRMTQKEEVFEFTFKEKPLYLRVDPQFDIFRKLHHNEIPPSLSKAYGSDNILILLPSGADAAILKNYSKLASIWAADTSLNIEIKRDSEISELPADKTVWIFGWENSYRNLIEVGIKGYNAEISGESVRLGDMTFSRDSNSFVISARNPRNQKSVMVWLTIGDSEAVGGLARKLPHYGKYSYLAFEGDQPTNISKGNWEVVDSPMASAISWGGESDSSRFVKELPKRDALAVLAPGFSAERMMRHIEYLASDELEGRGLGSKGIEKAAEYIAVRFEKAGLTPAGDNNTFFQTWEDVLDAEGKRGEIKNIIGVLSGAKEGLEKESVIVSAHYDHLGYGWPDVFKGNEGMIHPGADDNASGIAVMLELAARLGKNLKPDRNIVFVAFTAEENGLRGSKHYVENMKRFPVERCIGVLNLDTVGRLGDKKLLVLNSSSAREWKHIFMGSSYVTGVESEMVSQDLDASDQVSFIEAGVPAVQIFSGPHGDYHRPTDTADKIDGAGLVKVAAFTREAIVYLADREEPLQFSGTEKKDSQAPVKRGRRRASTGCMPDFSFDGNGVRVASVSSGSPAAKVGMKKGDVIILLGDHRVNDLREYSDSLKLYKPGDRVEITFLRGNREISKNIVLGER